MPAAVEAFASALATYEMARHDALEEVESDEEILLLGRAHADAMEALLQVPAPDLPALIRKLEILSVEDCFALSREYRDPLFAAIIADARRLSEGE